MEWLVPYLPSLMFATLALLLFSGFPVAFILGGVGMGFGFLAFAIDPWLFDLPQFGVLPSRIFGSVVESLILTAVPMFIFMGTMLERSGVARDLLNCLQVLMRRVPGGLALSVTLMGTILAATTGIIGASVVMMSLLALPIMLERGYAPALATGTIASSGTLGILIPPSIMLVIMADLMSRSVGTLFVAAIVPGFMLAGLYVIYIIIISILKPQNAPKLPAELGPKTTSQYMFMLLRSFLPPIFLIGCVLGSILGGLATPTEAAGVGAFGAIVLAVVNLIVLPALGVPEFHFDGEAQANLDDHSTGRGLWSDIKHFVRVLQETLISTGLTNAMVFGLFIGATLFSYMFRALGGEAQVESFIEHLGYGPWGLLFMIMGIVFLLGFFLDWIEITLIVLPVFAPVVSAMDFGDHILQSEVIYWFAILMAVNLQTSFLTPPFGFALFYMKAVAPKEIKIQQIYLGIIPFVFLQLIALALVVMFPDLALWLPRQLLD